MAFSTSGYAGFINSMLNLRSQRLKEAIANAEIEQQQQKQFSSQMSQMGKGLAGMFGSIGANQQQGRQDAMANSIMNERLAQPPRAQAVDPTMQGRADALAAGMPGFYRGGMDELKMRSDMEEMQQRQIGLKLRDENLKFNRSRYLTTEAEKAKRGRSAELNKSIGNNRSYIKDMHVYDDAMANAKSPEEYQSAVDAKIALNQSAIENGMKVEPIDPASIAPFMTQDEKDALSKQQTAVDTSRQELEAAQKAPPGIWDKMRSGLGLNQDSSILGVPITFDSERAIGAAQEKYKKEQDALRETKGADSYKDKSVTQKPSAGGQAAGGNAAPEGTEVTNAQGQTLIKSGGKWILKE